MRLLTTLALVAATTYISTVATPTGPRHAAPGVARSYGYAPRHAHRPTASYQPRHARVDTYVARHAAVAVGEYRPRHLRVDPVVIPAAQRKSFWRSLVESFAYGYRTA